MHRMLKSQTKCNKKWYSAPDLINYTIDVTNAQWNTIFNGVLDVFSLNKGKDIGGVQPFLLGNLYVMQ